MQALARIQQIQAQAAALSTVLRPDAFRQHLDIALETRTPSPEVGGQARASSMSPIQSGDLTHGLRPFPVLDSSGAPSLPSTMDIPGDIQLPASADRWLGEIEAAANRHGVPPKLLTALVWSESAFDHTAVSHAGAIGLAQLMPGTAAMMNVDPYDPIENIEGGARYIGAQLERFGEVDLALAAYNAGPARVARTGGVPNITETQNYVAIVTRRYQALEGGTQ